MFFFHLPSLMVIFLRGFDLAALKFPFAQWIYPPVNGDFMQSIAESITRAADVRPGFLASQRR
jgi:hypothetical protein